MISASACSKAVVPLLMIHVCCFVFGPCFVVQYIVSCLVCYNLAGEEGGHVL